MLYFCHQYLCSTSIKAKKIKNFSYHEARIKLECSWFGFSPDSLWKQEFLISFFLYRFLFWRCKLVVELCDSPNDKSKWEHKRLRHARSQFNNWLPAKKLLFFITKLWVSLELWKIWIGYINYVKYVYTCNSRSKPIHPFHLTSFCVCITKTGCIWTGNMRIWSRFWFWQTFTGSYYMLLLLLSRLDIRTRSCSPYFTGLLCVKINAYSLNVKQSAKPSKLICLQYVYKAIHIYVYIIYSYTCLFIYL